MKYSFDHETIFNASSKEEALRIRNALWQHGHRKGIKVHLKTDKLEDNHYCITMVKVPDVAARKPL